MLDYSLEPPAHDKMPKKCVGSPEFICVSNTRAVHVFISLLQQVYCEYLGAKGTSGKVPSTTPKRMYIWGLVCFWLSEERSAAVGIRFP